VPQIWRSQSGYISIAFFSRDHLFRLSPAATPARPPVCRRRVGSTVSFSATFFGLSEPAEGRCRHCWDRTELALHAGLEQQFFALFTCNATRNARWAPYAQESGARLARTARLRVAAGVLRNQLPAAVAEHARAQQHRRGHLRPRRGAWEAGRAKHMVTQSTRILRRFTVKPILFALPRTNKFGLEN
jgi:hypothetical protein